MAAASRKPADDLAVIVEDLIKLLDGVGSAAPWPLPDKAAAGRTAAVVRWPPTSRSRGRPRVGKPTMGR
jgi:CspA family cold shock protein